MMKLRHVFVLIFFGCVLVFTIALIARYHFHFPYPPQYTASVSVGQSLPKDFGITVEAPPTIYPEGRDIESFETSDSLLFWGSNTSIIRLSDQHATEGHNSIKVIFKPAKSAGIETYRLPRNWNPYSNFTFDVFNPQLESYWLTIRLDDHQSINGYSNRFNTILQVNPGMNHLQIPVEQITRKIDGADVTFLVIFLSNVTRPTTLYFDTLKLTKEPKHELTQ